MNVTPSTDEKSSPQHQDAVADVGAGSQSADIHALTSKGRRQTSPAAWVWVPLFVVVAAVIAIAVVSAVRRAGDDRGIRGPADQAAPNAPDTEKRPSSLGR